MESKIGSEIKSGIKSEIELKSAELQSAHIMPRTCWSVKLRPVDISQEGRDYLRRLPKKLHPSFVYINVGPVCHDKIPDF